MKLKVKISSINYTGSDNYYNYEIDCFLEKCLVMYYIRMSRKTSLYKAGDIAEIETKFDNWANQRIISNMRPCNGMEILKFRREFG